MGVRAMGVRAMGVRTMGVRAMGVRTMGVRTIGVRTMSAAAESGPLEMSVKLHYVIDAGPSQFTARVFSGGLLSAFGHSPTIAIRDFAGETEVNSEHLERSSLKLTIRAASLTVQDDISDKDRREIERTMHQEILETPAYPEIVYECSSVAASKTAEGQYSATLNGDLTLHGVTRSQPVSARVTLDGTSLRAFGNFSILQTDYDLKLASVAGGALKVKDELKFSFNILARKKE
jgi:polyisoprenoid-binding protein YceI